MKNALYFLVLMTISYTALAQQSFEVKVTQKGFEPSKLEVKSGEEVTLNITRTVKATCAQKISVPSLNIEKDLPLNKTVSVVIPASDKGEIKFGCAMQQMLGGVILVN